MAMSGETGTNMAAISSQPCQTTEGCPISQCHDGSTKATAHAIVLSLAPKKGLFVYHLQLVIWLFTYPWRIPSPCQEATYNMYIDTMNHHEHSGTHWYVYHINYESPLMNHYEASLVASFFRLIHPWFTHHGTSPGPTEVRSRRRTPSPRGCIIPASGRSTRP